MKILECQKEKLLVPLQLVSGIVERKHTLPILSNVLLEKKENELTFLATDIEIQVKTSIHLDEDGGEDYAITVGARKFLDILRSLPDQAKIVLETTEKRLLLKSGKSRFTLQTLSADDFPRLPDESASDFKINMPQKDFGDLIAKTQYAMAVQDVRYYLNGLLLVLEENRLTCVSTDGHRLGYCCKNVEYSGERKEVIIPRKTIIEISRLISDTDNIEISFFDSQICFEFSNVNLVTKLIDGKFPDYEKVIPASFLYNISIERKLILSSLNRASIMTNDKFRGVRLIIKENIMRIKALNNEQEESEEEIDIDYSGETIDVGFNINYLIDVFSNLKNDVVNWKFNDSNSSSLVSVSDSDDFKYVIMPMRI